MEICIASDHAGFEYKTEIIKHPKSMGHEVTDCGTNTSESVDYPDFIKPAAKLVAMGKTEIGIVLGGSGNGEAMAANKISGIRCAVCWNNESVKLAKEHNNANMISIGQRMVALETALQIVDTWLNSKFDGSRHIPRVDKIEKEH